MPAHVQGLLVSLLWCAMGALLCYGAMTLAAPSGGGTALPARAAHPQQQHGGHAVDRFHAVPCLPPHQPGNQRRNLVFAAVGEGWTADK